ncbi:Pentatricopeptide repeat-containing protein [Capsicum annuum]|uniref:Pentatricopeptide repeat-containing protein n=1 Tax=Capsicum annuum TaxID=4072 RepID=A0A1U8FY46_CAPAN|nr:pentatricopeptide repeat-containing protein At3g29230 [Capsicum annuum]KAF3648689.1 Pentatricopeptide repeat-containing protein [Capsicum annuum]PHT91914.1 Pentatricopeptide repeat-containing protein [Capsicum annuum]
MQMPTPIRAPTWVSRRRHFEQKLWDLDKCKDINQLKQMQTLVYKSHLQQDPFIAPKLISAFSNCRQIGSALKVFEQAGESNSNVRLYNALIRAYVCNFQALKGFETFLNMQCAGIFPDNFTFSFLLKGCSGKCWLSLVSMIHTHVVKWGFVDDIYVPNSLIDAYSKCGVVGVRAAGKLFRGMKERDVVSWNSMVGALLKAGDLSEARKVFDEMPERDRVSWNTMLDGYTKAEQMSVAFELFKNMPQRDVVSWSTMVSGYCKAGDLEMARMLFDKMPSKNLISWTIMISGYAEKGLVNEAIELYVQMEETGLRLDVAAFVSILAACAESGMLSLGVRVHDTVERSMYKCNTLVCNALIDMYAKCGSLHKAYKVFNGLKKRDLVSWNAMIHGLAMHGRGKKALELFVKMKQEGFVPDKVTLVGILCACNHTGLVDEGIIYFYSMEKDYGVIPEVEHYGCLIDLLGRGGYVREAFELARKMPLEPNVKIWGSLLGACRMHKAIELADDVRDLLVKLEPKNAGKLSALSNIYASAGDWDNVANIRLMMKSIGRPKQSGASLLQLNDEYHEFTVMDKSHVKSDKIYQMVDGLGQHLKLLSPVPAGHCDE